MKKKRAYLEELIPDQEKAIYPQNLVEKNNFSPKEVRNIFEIKKRTLEFHFFPSEVKLSINTGRSSKKKRAAKPQEDITTISPTVLSMRLFFDDYEDRENRYTVEDAIAILERWTIPIETGVPPNLRLVGMGLGPFIGKITSLNIRVTYWDSTNFIPLRAYAEVQMKWSSSNIFPEQKYSGMFLQIPVSKLNKKLKDDRLTRIR